MPDGVYIMAGGGFFVCGAAKLNAPHVLIVNTADINPVSGVPYPGGALNQIQFDTTGTVTLGRPSTGEYQGLAIYQPVTEALSAVHDPSVRCRHRRSSARSTQPRRTSHGQQPRDQRRRPDLCGECRRRR